MRFFRAAKYSAVRLSCFSLTQLCPYFISTYPAGRSFYFHLPCWALIFLRTYPAAPSFCFHLPCCALILFSLTLLRAYFSTHLPCCALILFSLTLLCPYYFAAHLPRCVLIFLRTYPAVPLFSTHLSSVHPSQVGLITSMELLHVMSYPLRLIAVVLFTRFAISPHYLGTARVDTLPLYGRHICCAILVELERLFPEFPITIPFVYFSCIHLRTLHEGLTFPFWDPPP